MDHKDFTHWQHVASTEATEVYHATAPEALGYTSVLIKILTDPSTAARQRFERAVVRQQAAVQAGCSHVASILAQGDWEGLPYCVMRRFSYSLPTLVPAETVDGSRWLFACATRLLAALRELQTKAQTSHGNLKPSNVLCTDFASAAGPEIFLTDLAGSHNGSPGDDLRALGRMLLGLIQGREISPQETPTAFARGAFWKRFGWDGQRWAAFCKTLASPAHADRADALELFTGWLAQLDPDRPYAKLKPTLLLLAALFALAAAAYGFFSRGQIPHHAAESTPAVHIEAPGPARLSPAATDKSPQKEPYLPKEIGNVTAQPSPFDLTTTPSPEIPAVIVSRKSLSLIPPAPMHEGDDVHPSSSPDMAEGLNSGQQNSFPTPTPTPERELSPIPSPSPFTVEIQSQTAASPLTATVKPAPAPGPSVGETIISSPSPTPTPTPIQLDPVEKLLESGRLAIASADFPAAITAYTQVLALKSNSLEALDERGTAYDYLRQPDKAEADYHKAILLEAKDAREHFYRGDAFDSLDDAGKAKVDYRNALKLKCVDARDFYQHGLAHFHLGENESAVKDFKTVIKLDPKHAFAYFRLGVTRWEMDQRDSAISNYNRAIELNPNFARAIENRAGNLAAKQTAAGYQAALEDYDRLIKVLPGYAITYRRRGAIRLNLASLNSSHDPQAVQLAITDFKQSLVLDPSKANVSAHAFLGRAYMKRGKPGDHDQAIVQYTAAILLDPTDAEFYKARAAAYSTQGRTEEAKQDLLKAGGTTSP